MSPRVIVIGAGSAGCVFAADIAGRARVTVLEAGRRMPRHDLLRARTPDEVAVAPDLRWSLPARLTGDRGWQASPGRVVGGSSLPNGGYFAAPVGADLRSWHLAGGEAWEPARVRAAIERVGRALGARPAPRTHPIAVAFAEASVAEGFGSALLPLGTVVHDGLPWTAAEAFLDGAPVEVRTGSRAARIVVEAGRAVGVEVAHADGSQETLPTDEVVLSAGAFGSARLLLASGIGPAPLLESHGIQTRVDLPGVGSAFSDHPTVWVEWIPTDLLAERDAGRDSAEGAFPLALPLGADGEPGDDLELLVCLRPPEVPAGPSSRFGLLVGLQRPVSRGSVAPTAAHPFAPMAIDYRYLADERDRAALRTGVRAAARLVASPAFAPLVERLADLDDATLRDDGRLDAWIAAHLGSAAHTCGTAPMGPSGDPGAVVDGAGRVRGVDGLRVADTSILPTAPSRAPGAIACAIGAIVAAQF
ncbi:GMC oxidoreductase [Microbacterium sp. BK668]|uniref:GMC family oxidoreductase n=1 Tax=Microbacterium sp. BK668 TaxID=2512118 RepID=UPI00105BD322|nr:GMC oxidoreductase [Microbacterium sp. BK668]TDN92563.1 choline dehydrogenase-like flavoprotein [Microbacterium sp. BK668]